MGIPSAATRALKLSLIALPCATTLIFFLHSRFHFNGNGNGFLSPQIVFFLVSYPIVFCWELSILVVHTRRHVFAPPHGSAAAETNPTDQLLVALEENGERSLAQYLAYLNLFMVSENNVDSWRRAAFFEETGETYKRIISVCLGPWEQMVIRLSEGLDGTSLDKKSDVLSHQMRSPTDYPVHENVKEAFTDLQEHPGSTGNISSTKKYVWCDRLNSRCLVIIATWKLIRRGPWGTLDTSTMLQGQRELSFSQQTKLKLSVPCLVMKSLGNARAVSKWSVCINWQLHNCWFVLCGGLQLSRHFQNCCSTFSGVFAYFGCKKKWPKMIGFLILGISGAHGI